LTEQRPGGARLARHSVLAFSGYAIPLLVAFFAIPFAARALGPARFGLLGLAWALVEYLSFVDLGLGRATVRFVAHSLGAGGRHLRQTVAVALATQTAVAAVAALALAVAAPHLAYGLFSLEPGVRAEAAAMFYAVAANLGIVVVIGALRGVLEGADRFDLSNAIKIPAATAATLIPAVGAVAGMSLATVFWGVFAVRVVAVAVTVAVIPRAVPGFAWEWPREWRQLRELLSFSAWLTVSSVINPILAGFDRIVLATVAGAAAVGLYTGPYEGATRLLMVPISAMAVLFPALSARTSAGHAEGTRRVVESALRQLALVMAVPVIVLFVFAPEILRVWLGPAFAGEGATALRILLVGVAANALAHVPSVFLYAIGRPDLPAKNHMLELAIHLPLTIVLVRTYGVAGAALAWTIRISLDALLLFYGAARHEAFRGFAVSRSLWAKTVALILGFAAVAALASGLDQAIPVAATLLLSSAAFAALAWIGALAGEERLAWAGAVPRIPGLRARDSG
jgi:O-antigen/teichoic acid export membrane protein